MLLVVDAMVVVRCLFTVCCLLFFVVSLIAAVAVVTRLLLLFTSRTSEMEGLRGLQGHDNAQRSHFDAYAT